MNNFARVASPHLEAHVQHVVADMRAHGDPARAISSNTLRAVAVIRALTSAVQAWASGRGPGAHVVEDLDVVVSEAGPGERVEEPAREVGLGEEGGEESGWRRKRSRRRERGKG
jgi:hypothetical protein